VRKTPNKTSIAEDLGFECYYTDTDSIHVDLEAIPHICKRYEELYGKELDGDELGQFNNDHKIKVKLAYFPGPEKSPLSRMPIPNRPLRH
jgi:hypothetical protein